MNPKPMNRYFNVKINGVNYPTIEGFSYGAYDAFKRVLKDTNPKFEPIPGGRVVAPNLMRFEGINYNDQIGIVGWVKEL